MHSTGHHMRLFMPHRMIFMLMGRGRNKKPTTAQKQEARAEYLRKSPRVAQYKQEMEVIRREQANSRDRTNALVRSGYPIGGGARVLPQPQGERPHTDRSEPHAHGRSGPAIVSDGLGWEALEQQLLNMVQENPELREVEVKHE